MTLEKVRVEYITDPLYQSPQAITHKNETEPIVNTAMLSIQC